MKAIEKEKLWEEYQKNPTPKLREQLIIEYAQLVRLVAACILGIMWKMMTW